MILNCPSCSTRFLIDPALLEPNGRRVRCGRCGDGWFQAPTGAPEGGAVASAEAAASTIPRLQEFDEARRRSAGARMMALTGPKVARRWPSPIAMGWTALAVVVVVLATGLLLGRDQLIAHLPETEKLYAATGLLPAAEPEKIGDGLELRDVRSIKRLVDGQQTLLIEGNIINASDGAKIVPKLRASVTDADGVELTHWTFSANGKDLEPGDSTTFQTSAESPAEGVNLSLIFVADEN